MASDTQRAAYAAAVDALTRIEMERQRLVEQTDASYRLAKDALATIEGDLGEPECQCESCRAFVFSGEPWLPGETPLCGECAPTFSELLTTPELFVNGEGDALSADECRDWYSRHIEGGGLPTDSMAYVSSSAPSVVL